MPKKTSGSLAKYKVSTAKGGFTVSTSVKLPLEKVWKAMTDDKALRAYFVDNIKGKFGPDLGPMKWFWKGYGWVSLQPTVWEPNERLEFLWQGPKCNYLVTVRYEFSRKNGKTVVKISERGYKTKDLANAFDTCEGWSQVLVYMKAWAVKKMDMRKI